MNTYVVELVFWHQDTPEIATVARVKIKRPWKPVQAVIDRMTEVYLEKYLAQNPEYNPEEVRSSSNLIVKES